MFKKSIFVCTIQHSNAAFIFYFCQLFLESIQGREQFYMLYDNHYHMNLHCLQNEFTAGIEKLHAHHIHRPSFFNIGYCYALQHIRFSPQMHVQQHTVYLVNSFWILCYKSLYASSRDDTTELEIWILYMIQNAPCRVYTVSIIVSTGVANTCHPMTWTLSHHIWTF